MAFSVVLFTISHADCKQQVLFENDIVCLPDILRRTFSGRPVDQVSKSLDDYAQNLESDCFDDRN